MNFLISTFPNPLQVEKSTLLGRLFENHPNMFGFSVSGKESDLLFASVWLSGPLIIIQTQPFHSLAVSHNVSIAVGPLLLLPCDPDPGSSCALLCVPAGVRKMDFHTHFLTISLNFLLLFTFFILFPAQSTLGT